MAETPVSLLERLRMRPDPESWQQLADLYSPLVAGWVRRYSLQGSDADDMVQEVLQVVLRELPRFHHNQRTGAFRHWLRAILVNCLRTFWRSQRARPQAMGGSDMFKLLEQLEDPHSDQSRLWQQEHDRHVVQGLLARIEPDFAPKTWLAFRRLVGEGQAADETARELGLSVNAVLIAKSRVLRRLRREAQDLVD